MNFVDPAFLLLLPATLGAYFWAGKHERRPALIVLVLSSAAFYGAHQPQDIPLLLASAGIAFWGGQLVAGSRRRRDLASIVILLLLPLGFYKYSSLIFGSKNAQILGAEGLPLGVSFFTFQNIAYVVAVYRGAWRPERRLLLYLAFSTYYAQLVAGPIVAARQLIPALGRQISIAQVDWKWALWMLGSGMAKKLVLADRIGLLVAPVFADPVAVGAESLCLAVVGYGLQIYLDFSGYTDMALALGLLIGVRLPENFDFPYAAVSFRDFWRRWHITLSQWLRDHVYIPLGGSRRGPSRTLLAIGVTMVLGGLWHGAHWNFAVWGAGHGLLLILERILKRALPGFKQYGIGRLLCRMGVLCGVLLLWVPFRTGFESGGWEKMWAMWAGLAAWRPGPVLISGSGGWLIGLTGVGVLMMGSSYSRLLGHWRRLDVASTGVVAGAVALLIVAAATGGGEFIYFVF